MTTAQTARTPGPWRVAARDDAVISGPHGEIAFCGSKDLARDDANAAFIVAACNAHDTLLADRDRLRAALQETERLIPELVRQLPAGAPMSVAAAHDRIRAALAQSEKGE